ncbi:MAG: 2-phospho-L-lactate transferase [Alphaproteobacteria bacterium]|nr:2-phospho-L-lactate transferase [Alphaproteobacteria bacterium]
MTGDRIIALSGGVGGAKLVLGLSHVLSAENLMVVTNTADDFDHLGLRICPDTDTVIYTLSGLSDPQRGWGRVNETWKFMEALRAMGGPDWFNLGDGDLALHVMRTDRLNAGETLTDVMRQIAADLGIGPVVVPMCDQPVSTMVQTTDGPLAFQHYFVREQCAPTVTGFEFAGIDAALPNPVLMEALDDKPAAILIAPSNPYVSVDPILAVPGLRSALKQSKTPIIAVSPIIGGQAIKGPAAKMMAELGASVSTVEIARFYQGFVDGLIIDEIDRHLAAEVAAFGIEVRVAQTVMRSLDDRIALARLALSFADELRERDGQ